MKYRLAAFDFDGTLADTLPWFESVMDGVADKYGFRKASAADKAQLRHRSTREIMAFLEVPVWKLPAIMAHVRQLMREIDPAVRMFAGVPAALAQLKAAGLRLAVCSSNSLDNVRRVLGPQTGALIDDYECGADLFGKPAKLARLMARHGVERTRCILIGDEMRDIDAARKAGVMAGSVAWGYNHVDALRAVRQTKSSSRWPIWPPCSRPAFLLPTDAMSSDPTHRITDLDTLQARYGTPAPNSLTKEVDYLHPHYRAFVEAAPFVVLATSGPQGWTPRRAATARVSSSSRTTARCCCRIDAATTASTACATSWPIRAWRCCSWCRGWARRCA